MAEFRALVEMTTNNYQDLIDLMQEASSSIEQELSGVVAWETFGDEETGTVLIHEVFVDEDAAETYEEFMESKGFPERAFELLNSARVLILDPVTRPSWTEVAARPSSLCLRPISAFRRGK